MVDDPGSPMTDTAAWARVSIEVDPEHDDVMAMLGDEEWRREFAEAIERGLRDGMIGRLVGGRLLDLTARWLVSGDLRVEVRMRIWAHHPAPRGVLGFSFMVRRVVARQVDAARVCEWVSAIFLEQAFDRLARLARYPDGRS